jgi:cyclase
MSMTRREVLGRVASGSLVMAAALRSAAPAAAQILNTTPPPPDPRAPQVPTWKTEFRQLAPNIYAFIQGGGPGQAALGVSNAGLVVGPDHLMAIDATGAPLHARAFIDASRKAAPGKPFRRLLNTHHHGDHVNGNQFFGGAEIISHPYCREEVLKAIPSTPAKWDKRDGWATGAEPRKLVPPTTTIAGDMVYHYGDTAVQVQFLGPAHTYGDLIVYVPQYKLLFASDIAFYYVAPFAHNGHVGKWIDTIDRILAMDVDTIVPGHGPIGGKKELAETAEYFKLLRAEVRKRYDAGMTAGRAAADIRLGKFDNWIGPERIVMNTVRLYNEFRGTDSPDYDLEGTKRATDEYNAIRAGGRS